METSYERLNFYIYVCSKNSIAAWAIERLLTQMDSNRHRATWLPNQLITVSPGAHILLIDAFSIPEWPEIVHKWTEAGHRTILITTESWGSGIAALRALHLGVRGIVSISPDFSQQLSDAINAVAKGQLFASAETLDEFYYGHRRMRSRSATPCLSFREEQVIDLLAKDFSNRRIGAVLGISERTAKFHVCNLLRKLQVRSRRELVDKYGHVLNQHKSA
jgi:DNA-binding NarL/FixJ family response regulator